MWMTPWLGCVDDDATAQTDDAEARADGTGHGSDVWMMRRQGSDWLRPMEEATVQTYG